MNLEGWTGWVVTAVVLIAFVLAVWLDARRWLRREPVVPPEPPEDPYWQAFEEQLLAYGHAWLKNRLGDDWYVNPGLGNVLSSSDGTKLVTEWQVMRLPTMERCAVLAAIKEGPRR